MWEEIEVKSWMPYGTFYVLVTAARGQVKLTFPTHLTPNFKDYKYCKGIVDVNKRLIGLQLSNTVTQNCNNILFHKVHAYSNERVSVSFTRQWNYARDKLRLPYIDKSLKYEIYKEREGFFVIDCNKPL